MEARIAINREAIDWMEAMANNGMLMRNADGKWDLSPMVKDLILATHHVLAGGDVSYKIASPGNEETLALLNTKLETMLETMPTAVGDELAGLMP